MQDTAKKYIWEGTNLNKEEVAPVPVTGKTVLTGNNNTVTIIERQYNDKSAAYTVAEMLSQQAKSDQAQRDLMSGITAIISETVKKFMDAKMAAPKCATQGQAEAPVAKPVTKRTYKKSAVKTNTKTKK